MGRHRRHSRRAERHGYQSLTARHSRDLLLISGRVDRGQHSGPLCTPPGAPPRRSFNFRKTARARGSSCGSFLPSLRSVRRSPSAPRKCPIRFALWVDSVSAIDYSLLVFWDSSLLFRQFAGFIVVLLLFCCPSGMWVRRSEKFGTPARAQQGEHGGGSKRGFAAARIWNSKGYRKKSPKRAH